MDDGSPASGKLANGLALVEDPAAAAAVHGIGPVIGCRGDRQLECVSVVVGGVI